MKNRTLLSFFYFFLISFAFCYVSDVQAQSGFASEEKQVVDDGKSKLVVGAQRTEAYFALLKGKRIALVANHSSRIKGTHLIDSLLSAGFDIVTIFTPEHGFRGEASAGESVSDAVDAKTGLPIISLYGKNKKPRDNQLKDVDIVLFDIQDVGARFYTYISTLHYVMEACAENEILLMVLDRPNPNGFYVDGPILEEEQQSFVGMHPVPVVHGMTIGEYAKMINGEHWLKNGIACELKVVSMTNYNHSTKYQLPVKPSPNLPNMLSIYLYPSLCFFEGTAISVGRGTLFPFQQIGHPSLWEDHDYFFIPKAMVGAMDPKFEGQECFGYFFGADSVEKWLLDPKIKLEWLLEFYRSFENKERFFTNYFNLLAGNSTLKQKIIDGKTAAEIRASWQKELDKFRLVRKKYLLYDDF